MYEYLKMLQPVAEQIGEVKEVRESLKNAPYTENMVRINGVTKDGRKFELELTVEDKDADADDRD